jgi:hypothetical protein
MSQKTKVAIRWSLASLALTDEYIDFMLSRQAMNCSPATLDFARKKPVRMGEH